MEDGPVYSAVRLAEDNSVRVSVYEVGPVIALAAGTVNVAAIANVNAIKTGRRFGTVRVKVEFFMGVAVFGVISKVG